MGIIKISSCTGSMLAMACIFLTIFILMGYGLINLGAIDAIEVVKADKYVQAFWLAEAGLARTLLHLKLEYDKSNIMSDNNWADGDINNIDYSGGFLDYDSTSLGKGSYKVEIITINDEGGNPKVDEVWIRSTGVIDEGSPIETKRTIRTKVNMRDMAVWNYAIFANSGQGEDTAIHGNVDIRGSVLLLGNESNVALNMGAGSHIGNNYSSFGGNKGISFYNLLNAKIPSLPLVYYEGEEDPLESLCANLWVKNGKVSFGGDARVGERDDLPGDDDRETMDGVHVSDGQSWVDNKGNPLEDDEIDNFVFSDNGFHDPYSLPEEVRYPKLQDEGDWDEDDGQDIEETYREYLYRIGLKIDSETPDDILNKIADINAETESFSYSDDVTGNSISWDKASKNLDIDGVIYIDGGSLGFNKAGKDRTITYSGSGSIFVTGDVTTTADLVTTGNFPDSIIGIMTPSNITFGESQVQAMGLFYCEGTVTVEKQTAIAGSILGEYFIMGNEKGQVPSIFQVPSVVDNYPPGMIGTKPIWVLFISDWQEIPSGS